MLTATNSWGTVIGFGNSFFSAANFANPSTMGPKSVPLLPKKYLIPRARRISKYAWATVSTGKVRFVSIKGLLKGAPPRVLSDPIAFSGKCLQKMPIDQGLYLTGLCFQPCCLRRSLREEDLIDNRYGGGDRGAFFLSGVWPSGYRRPSGAQL